MNIITIGMAYYMNAGMLRYQYDNLVKQPPEVLENLRLIVVDDGSPDAPSPPLPPGEISHLVQLYRMKEDIPWNQDACRNLAVKQAKESEWLLLTDMDHMPSSKLLKRLVTEDKFFPDVAYTMRRVSAPDLSPYKPHPNSWVLTGKMYWKAGGYDERFRGIYGTDGDFKRRLQVTARKFLEFKEALIRYPREVVPDASTSTLERRDPRYDHMKVKVRQEIANSTKRDPIHFLTPWERIF